MKQNICPEVKGEPEPGTERSLGPGSGPAPEQLRALTWKSLVFGLIGAALIAAGGQICPVLGKQAVLGGYLGTALFFYFFLLCALWNPLACRFLKKLEIHPKELATILVMTSAACGFSWLGWLRQVYAQSAMIPQKAITDPKWLTYGTLDYFNKDTLLNGGEFDERVTNVFLNGQSTDRSFLGLREALAQIPFDGWGNMRYWAVLLILATVVSLALLLIVHRQWIRNEKLTYPLASVAESLYVKSDPKQCFSDVLRTNLFWLAFFFVFLLELYNYLTILFPTSGFANVPNHYNLEGALNLFPITKSVWSSRMLEIITINYAVIGISYFLAPALSLSIGLNAFVYTLFAIQVYEFTGSDVSDPQIQAFRAGAYLAFLLTLVFLGRRFYGPLFLKALFFGKAETEEEKTAIFGARMFLIAAFGMAVTMTLMGVDFLFALILTITFLVVYTVFTRIICETGIPEMVTPFLPVNLFTRIFGAASLGPHNLMAGGSLSGVLFGDMRNLVMPNMAMSLKTANDAGVKLRRCAYLILIAAVFAFALAFVVHLWQNYSIGVETGMKTHSWAQEVKTSFNAVARLFINEQLDEVKAMTVWERIGQISFRENDLLIFFLIGLACVFLTGVLRTRFLWWPFHAAMFCIWRTGPANELWASFLIGWMIRAAVIRLGGETNYLKLKPVFYGLIFGSVFSKGMLLLSGLCQYWFAGA